MLHMIACNAAVVYIWPGRLAGTLTACYTVTHMQCHTAIHTAW